MRLNNTWLNNPEIRSKAQAKRGAIRGCRTLGSELRRTSNLAYRDSQQEAAEILAEGGAISPGAAARELAKARTQPLRIKEAQEGSGWEGGQVVWVGGRRSQILTVVYDFSPWLLSEAARAAGASVVSKILE